MCSYEQYSPESVPTILKRFYSSVAINLHYYTFLHFVMRKFLKQAAKFAHLLATQIPKKIPMLDMLVYSYHSISSKIENDFHFKNGNVQ